MAKQKIKTGDNVLVLTGKDEGKTGKVLEVLPKEGKVIVENINVVTKHQKPKSAQDKGGIIKKSAPIEASNLMVVCATCGKATRIARKTVDGANVRVCKKCGASLDKKFVKTVKKETKKAEKVEKTVKEEVKKDQNVTKKPVASKSSSVKSTRDNVKTTVRKTVAGGK